MCRRLWRVQVPFGCCRYEGVSWSFFTWVLPVALASAFCISIYMSADIHDSTSVKAGMLNFRNKSNCISRLNEMRFNMAERVFTWCECRRSNVHDLAIGRRAFCVVSEGLSLGDITLHFTGGRRKICGRCLHISFRINEISCIFHVMAGFNSRVMKRCGRPTLTRATRSCPFNFGPSFQVMEL